MCLSHLIYTVRPCLIHTCHAMPMPFFSRPRHSTAFQRQPVGYLPAFSFFRLPRGVPRRLLSEAYQSSSQRSIPTTVRVVVAHYKIDDMLNCWTNSSDISGYHADFHEGHGNVGAGQGRGMACVNLRHGMAGERYGCGMGTACYVWIGLKEFHAEYSSEVMAILRI